MNTPFANIQVPGLAQEFAYWVSGLRLCQTHEEWLAQPGKKGVAYNPTGMHRFLLDYAKRNLSRYSADQMDRYLEAWRLIEARAPHPLS